MSPGARRALRIAGRVGFAVVGLPVLSWCALAIRFSNLPWDAGRVGLAVLFVLGAGAALLLLRPRRRGVVAVLAAAVAVAAWHASIRPPASAAYKAEYARVATATFAGDLVTLRNVRDFAWLSDTRSEPDWYDAVYDLRDLRTVDLAVCLWTGGALGHVLLSFGFADGRHLCASVESRQEEGESYAPLPGMFKQYELAYVFADERDILHRRAAVRDETVFLHRVRTTPGRARRVLEAYLARANALAERPEFYHSLTNNCTTNVLFHARVVRPDLPFTPDLLRNGFSDRYALEHGLLEADLPFAELRARARINEAARTAGRAPDFSARIRGVTSSR